VKPFAAIVPRGLVVSCQAPAGDPLHGGPLRARRAAPAAAGGAVAIRADGAQDILAIRESVELPIIGSRKSSYASSPVCITPTFDEAADAFQSGANVVAVDGTQRPRPRGEDLAGLIARIHAELAVPVLADVASLEDGVRAAALGADAIATTLAGYVDDGTPPQTPDLSLVRALAAAVAVPVIAEGRYRTPDEAAQAIDVGAYAVVVGGAITRPHLIARRFADALSLNREPPDRPAGPADDELRELAQALITSRQNVSPKRLVAPGPDAEQLARIWEAAAAAPDHGEIVPWRFIVVPALERRRLGEVFAQALLDRDPQAAPDQVAQAREKALRAPLLILAVAQLGARDPDIPASERMVSLGCAIQNMLLAAHAAGFGAGLTSGQAMRAARMHELFALADGEEPVCFVNIGTVTKRKPLRSRPGAADFVREL
jgi:putative N-acetylmannosamine-6-phosphate epimerase/nitroreductase